MQPIRQGDRGAAVEDIQRRLLVLGFDLGPTGVDGVFLGRTAEAVGSFQERLGLAEDGVVGPRTWAALVDATFTLGDRMLYLRHPFFHGRDVATLQGALNVLGFACGRLDGIFGAYTERAVREFQANSGQVADGIVGDESVRAILGLKHVWEGKDPAAPAALSVAGARRAEVLRGAAVVIEPVGPIAQDVARRLVNLATAAEPGSAIRFADPAIPPGRERLLLRLAEHGSCGARAPVVSFEGLPTSALAARLLTALAASRGEPPAVCVELGAGPPGDEREAQRIAVLLLDALCAALA